MWLAPPTLRQMFWMLWEGFKNDLNPPKTCNICGSSNPSEHHRDLKLCTRCHAGVREMMKKA